MLKYFIAVTENLAVLAVLLGLLYAHVLEKYGDRGRRALNIGALAGAVLAVVYTFLRNTTKIIDKSGGNTMWNVRVFAVSVAALLLFYLFSLKPLKKPGRVMAPIAAGLLTFTLVFYALPEVLAYPSNFNLNGASILSTAFIYRFIGFLLGWALCLLLWLAVYRVARRSGGALVTGLMCAALFVNAFEQVAKALQVLYAKRIVSGKKLFKFIRFTSNHSNLFIYLSLAAALVISLTLWALSFNVKEPYSNPAEHRKIRAKWRSIRRWATTVIACLVMVTLCLTWLTAIDNKVVELSPAEEFEVRDDACWIPLTQVEDGHLHRFEYTTENNVGVRFIIIKKPNSSAYGVGLDACDICGETGYFERGGQVVCKLCDVVMNINTIGFKGGCNPIVIDYSVSNGFIIVPISTLMEHEREFKN